MWEHPRERYSDGEGYRPMHDRDFDAAMKAWITDLQTWLAGGLETTLLEHYADDTDTQGRWLREPIRAFAEWHGAPPDPERHRPQWGPGEATAFQVYETVTEGTPISPVCADEEALISWCMLDHPDVGWPALSREGAERFLAAKWAPSFVMDSKGFRSGVEAIAEPGWKRG